MLSNLNEIISRMVGTEAILELGQISTSTKKHGDDQRR